MESGNIFKIPPIPIKSNCYDKHKLANANQMKVNQFGHYDRPSNVINILHDNFLPTVVDNFRWPEPARYHKLTRRLKFIL